MDFKALFSKEEGNPGARVTVGLPWEDMSACKFNGFLNTFIRFQACYVTYHLEASILFSLSFC